MFLTKGDRVRVHFFQVSDPPGSLAGMQMKFGASEFDLTGTVSHVRANAPTEAEATDIQIWVRPDAPVPNSLRVKHCEKCGCGEVGPLNPAVLKEVLR